MVSPRFKSLALGNFYRLTGFQSPWQYTTLSSVMSVSESVRQWRIACDKLRETRERIKATTVSLAVTVNRLHVPQLFKHSVRKTQYFTNSCSKTAPTWSSASWQLFTPPSHKFLTVLFSLELVFCYGKTMETKKLGQRWKFLTKLRLRVCASSTGRCCDHSWNHGRFANSWLCKAISPRYRLEGFLAANERLRRDDWLI